MPVTHVDTDIENCTLTITAEFAGPVERIWQVYADVDQLAQIWGPPGWPATFEKHELTPGGEVHYFMTGPDGTKGHGLWRITDVTEPTSFAFDDYFASADYQPVDGMPPSHMTYTFAAGALSGGGAGTVATYVAVYDSPEALQQVLDMGMAEGASASIGQIDDLIAA